MAETYTIKNVWMAYIGNSPYVYPNDDENIISASTINTGWHVIPNMLWRHLVTPAQWYSMVHNFEAYHVDSISCTIFNMVPMTQQLSIQGTDVFTAFNNAIYGMAYKDELYETSWYNWLGYDTNTAGHNLLYKEGLVCNWNSSTKRRYVLPTYAWSVPDARATTVNTYNFYRTLHKRCQDSKPNESAVFPGGQTTVDSDNIAASANNAVTNYRGRPSGIIWDPLNRPDEIMELRAGKNQIQFSWNTHDCDQGKWFNTDLMAWWYPYTPEGPYHSHRGRPGQRQYSSWVDPDRFSMRFETCLDPSSASSQTSDGPINDYTIPNYSYLPVVPSTWWWNEMRLSISPASMTDFQLRYMDMFFTGTEYQAYKYPPTQWFCKMLPIFDSKGTHIECSAQISVQTTLTLTCKKRRTAIYAPTYGPHNWFNLYSARSEDMNYTPSLIRYRTGGARRTWQNMADSSNPLAHPRTSPFVSTTYPAGTGQGGTYSVTTTYTTAGRRTPSAPILEEPMEQSRPRSRSPRIQYPDLPTGHQI